ncbi:hypothetical protein [uncultured Roseobacter sp.]|uniref:hypothetical protein n=1 Tax=uncultured Roseobacter sp. TaxID=114847 RepID=UPI0026219952|nr:hypothetical protein [uncultured Roseobacter sp.]
MLILKCLRFAVLWGLCLTGSTMAAGGACSGFANPQGSAGLERVKGLISEGRFAEAFERFDVSEDAKRRLAEGLEAVVSEEALECITIKRSRQNPDFISEVFMTVGESGALYWTVSGIVDGLAFRMISFTYTDEFEDIRELIY